MSPRRAFALGAIVITGVVLVVWSRRKREAGTAHVKPARGSSPATKFKRAVFKVVASRRFSEGAYTPSTSDAPLQRAVAALKKLGASMESQAQVEDADSVNAIIELLHSQHFCRHGSSQRMMAEMLKDATSQEKLGLHQWVAQADVDADISDPTGNASATQNSELSHRLMKWTRSVPRLELPSSDSARLAHILEHDLLMWEIDMNEIHRLSAGHALLAFGWALIERHGLRVTRHATRGRIPGHDHTHGMTIPMA